MSIEDEGWYRVPDEKIRPGDIFSLAPSFRALKLPLRCVGNSQKQRDKEFIELFGTQTPLPARIAEGKQDGTFLAPGMLTFGVLLSRGCEVDQGKFRQLAIVRPLSMIQGDKDRSAEENQAAVIDGEVFANHYLPAVPEALGSTFPDSYVDFRYICTIMAPLLATLSRVISLSRIAVEQLYFGWMRHTAGLVPTPGPCPECGQSIRLLVAAPGMLSPGDDW